MLAAPELTGATRLAVTACNRIGAGLVSVIAEQRSDVYRTSLPADIMVQEKIPEKTSVCLGGSGGIVPLASGLFVTRTILEGEDI